MLKKSQLTLVALLSLSVYSGAAFAKSALASSTVEQVPNLVQLNQAQTQINGAVIKQLFSQAQNMIKQDKKGTAKFDRMVSPSTLQTMVGLWPTKEQNQGKGFGIAIDQYQSEPMHISEIMYNGSTLDNESEALWLKLSGSEQQDPILVMQDSESYTITFATAEYSYTFKGAKGSGQTLDASWSRVR